MKSAGFSLLEVLVAIVVLSFGVLGVVGLQAAALQANKEARYQSTAVRLGRELADMMRGNKDVAKLTSAASNFYLVPFPGFSGALGAGNWPPAPEDCSVITCTSPATLAQFQIRDWLSRADIELPHVQVVVCFDTTPYVAGTGLPQWFCTGGANAVQVIKIGWSRQTLDRSATGAAVIDRASAPSVVMPALVLP